MDARHLELLRELADRGSIAAVAAATHRTPSAVSQQLKTAGREAGTALVEPAGRGVRLTDAGRVLAAGGAQVATTLAQVQAQWDEFLGRPSGTVTVAALPSAATFLLPGVEQELADTEIRLVCTDLDVAEADYAALAADHDVVVAHSLTGRRPLGTDDLVVVPLADEPLDVAMAADHPLADREVLHAADTVASTWVGVPPGYPFDVVLRSVARVTGTQPDVAQRLRDNRLVEELVATSRRIAVLPRFTTPTGGRLVLRELTDVPAVRHVCAVLRPDRAERHAVRRVLEALVRAGADASRSHGVASPDSDAAGSP